MYTLWSQQTKKHEKKRARRQMTKNFVRKILKLYNWTTGVWGCLVYFCFMHCWNLLWKVEVIIIKQIVQWLKMQANLPHTDATLPHYLCHSVLGAKWHEELALSFSTEGLDWKSGRISSHENNNNNNNLQELELSAREVVESLSSEVL